MVPGMGMSGLQALAGSGGTPGGLQDMAGGAPPSPGAPTGIPPVYQALDARYKQCVQALKDAAEAARIAGDDTAYAKLTQMSSTVLSMSVQKAQQLQKAMDSYVGATNGGYGT